MQDPRRDEPFHFQEQGPDPLANPALTWALRIAGLVAIAVISGLVWAYVQEEPPARTADPGISEPASPSGRFAFTPHQDMSTPQRDQNCAENSHGKVREFFVENPCEQLTRALYTSKPADQPGGEDRTVYTAVMVVRMPTVDQARTLYDKARTDNTGNVSDPIKADIVTIDGIDDSLRGQGYFSQLNDRDVIIVESDWAPSGKRSEAENTFLKAVSADAIRYGKEFAAQG